MDEYLRNNPQFIIELKDIEEFKRLIWIELLRNNESDLNNLLSLYDTTFKDIDIIRRKAKNQETKWHEVIEIFKERFDVPFIIETNNLEDVILQDDIPMFKYTFTAKDALRKEIKRDELLQTLSTGEKRAYYLLNLIYQVEIKRLEDKAGLLVLDDIADSFDYKNKYAIIEYINDIINMKSSSRSNLFSVIILTHNFDFYRTIGSRLIHRDNCFIANVSEGCVKLEKGEYLKTYFSYMKEQCLKNDKIFIIAAVPFVRNLIEYIYSRDDDQYSDYDTLTSLLHIKKDTNSIQITDLQDIYNKYWLNEKGDFTVFGKKSITDLIDEAAEQITNSPNLLNSINIENKIVLSIAIRLNAEKYIIKQIKEYVDDGDERIKEIQSEANQTPRLFDCYKENKAQFPDCYEDILNKVIMMTPENIHMNSFMYEPIIDMQCAHLQKLYDNLKKLLSR